MDGKLRMKNEKIKNEELRMKIMPFRGMG